MLFGRVSRKIILARPKTISSIFSYQTRLDLQMGLASKVSFLAANTQDEFGEHKDKKYPMCTNEIYYFIFNIVGLYFCWRSWTSCLDAWHHGFYQIPTDKKNQVTDSVRNLIMGHVWIFQPDNNPNTNLKNNTKMGHWPQNQASAIAISVLRPEPCRKWVRWTEEKKHRHGAGNLKDLEWFWRKEWSLISCQVFSNLIRYYRRQFRAVKLANGGFKKFWIKECH